MWLIWGCQSLFTKFHAWFYSPSIGREMKKSSCLSATQCRGNAILPTRKSWFLYPACHCLTRFHQLHLSITSFSLNNWESSTTKDVFIVDGLHALPTWEYCHNMLQFRIHATMFDLSVQPIHTLDAVQVIVSDKQKWKEWPLCLSGRCMYIYFSTQIYILRQSSLLWTTLVLNHHLQTL